ncbi:MAG TPA: hypothetical protein VFT96_08590 [Gemmatimonadaceae bacterium]|nr:hypothetical protein [Gemmatimonadaceae bacterium]
MQVAGPTAALAGVPAGIQGAGPWLGRRQLFVKFAAEAETATMFTAAALAQEIRRLAARAPYHSLSISGRDPLANAEYLCAMFATEQCPLPVMLDIDGERPEELRSVLRNLSLLQVTVTGMPTDASLERAAASIALGSSLSVEHALVLCPNEQATDAQLLRAVEQAHGASERVQVVIHPPVGEPIDRDRRWVSLIERAASVHADVRLMLRIPSPIGMR